MVSEGWWATAVSYDSGNAGGDCLDPSLCLGAMGAGRLKRGAALFFELPVASAGAYALVGMGDRFEGIISSDRMDVGGADF